MKFTKKDNTGDLFKIFNRILSRSTRQVERGSESRRSISIFGHGLARQVGTFATQERAQASSVVVDSAHTTAIALDGQLGVDRDGGDVEVDLGGEPGGAVGEDLDAVLGDAGEEACLVQSLDGDGLVGVDDAAIDEALDFGQVDGHHGPRKGRVFEACFLDALVQRRLSSFEAGARLLALLPLAFVSPAAGLALGAALASAHSSRHFARTLSVFQVVERHQIAQGQRCSRQRDPVLRS